VCLQLSDAHAQPVLHQQPFNQAFVAARRLVPAGNAVMIQLIG
jgi:hypothetical protein